MVTMSRLHHDFQWAVFTCTHAMIVLLWRQVMRRNRREREDERSSEPDMVDGQMLWLLMQRLRRHARNRVGTHDGELFGKSRARQ